MCKPQARLDYLLPLGEESKAALSQPRGFYLSGEDGRGWKGSDGDERSMIHAPNYIYLGPLQPHLLPYKGIAGVPYDCASGPGPGGPILAVQGSLWKFLPKETPPQED